MLAGCFSYWCGCCQIYNTAEDLGESGMLYLLLSCITPCVPIMMMRGKAREQFDIQGQTFALLGRKVSRSPIDRSNNICPLIALVQETRLTMP